MYRYICLALGIAAYLILSAHSQILCERLVNVTYTKFKIERELMPFKSNKNMTYWRFKNVTKTEIAYKTEPQKFCCEGYMGSISNCQPVCREGCDENSFCQKPNHCECKDGYQHPIEGHPSCVPKCISDCGLNEYCAQPDKCDCLNGYYKDEDGNCSPNSNWIIILLCCIGVCVLIMSSAVLAHIFLRKPREIFYIIDPTGVNPSTVSYARESL